MRMRIDRSVGIVASLVMTACGPAERAPADAAPDDAAATRSVRLADTLLFTTPTGFEIWWTATRESAGPGDTPCRERAVEIRRDTTRRLIPLLYTAVPPTPLNDTTIRAVLSTQCVAGAAYRIDLRSAQPLPESP